MKPRRKLRTRVTLLFFLFSALPAVVVTAIAAIVLKEAIDDEIERRGSEARASTQLVIKNVTDGVRGAVSTFAESEELRRVALEPLEQGDQPDPGALETLLDKAMNTSGLDLLAVVEVRGGKGVILASAHSPASIEKAAPAFARVRISETTTVGFAHELTAGNPPAWAPAIVGVRGVSNVAGAELVVYGGMRLDTHRLEAIAMNGRARLVLRSPHLSPIAFPKGITTEGSENDGAMILPALIGGRAKPAWATSDPDETIDPKTPTKLHVRVNTHALESARARFITAAGVLALVALIAALIAGTLISRPITEPILELAGAAQKIGAGELGVHIEPSSNDEVGALVEVFNNMSSEIAESRVRLQRAERIAAWREIARRVAHEIKNPLFPIQMSMETLRKSFRAKHPALEEIVEESTRTVLEEVRALNRIVTEFSDFARLPAPKTEPIAPAELLDHARALFSGKTQTPVEIVFERAAIEARGLPAVSADREQLGRVLLNLVKNAIEAMAAGGRIILDASAEIRGNKSGVLFSVRDNGAGISAELLEKIFTPYFTTKSAGTGLGLAIVDRIVAEHQGTISVESTVGVGTEFRIWLPSA
jgi:nitrogen fixation/metabolism regulation signal transduction histidine kinase